MKLLEGYRILELGGEPAAYCGKVLAELGAEVVVIEPPDSPATLRNSYRHLNKRRLKRDLSGKAGQPALAALLPEFGAVVDGGAWTSPAERESGGLYSVLKSLAERSQTPLPAIWVSLSPFGEWGPHAGYRAPPLINFAMSGGMFPSGDPALPPCTAPGTLPEDAAAIHGAVAIVAALFERPAGGSPRHCEISVQEAAIPSLWPWSISGYSYADRYPGAAALRARTGNVAYPVYPCRDGFVRLLTVSPGQWQVLVEWLGNPELLQTPDWQLQRYRLANQDAIFGLVCELTAERTMLELFHEGQRRGVAISPVYRPSNLPSDPHLRARGFFRSAADPALGGHPIAGPPYIFRSDAAAGDADSQQPATAESGFHSRVRSADPAGQADRAFPLSGYRVLELAVGAAGPELCRLLAELGADVIKIESRRYPDFTRTIGFGGPADLDGCAYFNETNRNKRSVALDLRTDGGKDLARRLAALCDVVVENNRGHVAASLGLNYAALCAMRPDLVYLSSQGYGGGGPYADYLAYGANLSAASGMTYLWNHPDPPLPVGTSLNHPDHIASKQGGLAVLAALAKRRQAGQGYHIDLAQIEVAIGLIGETVLEAAFTGEDPLPLGNRHPVFAPHGAYPCQPDADWPDLDRWCTIAVTTEAEWASLCAAVGHPEWLADPRFAGFAGRKACEDELDRAIATWTSGRCATTVMEKLQAAGVPAGVVQNAADQLADPHLRVRDFLIEIDHPVVGPRRYPANPIRTDAGFIVPSRRAPLLGEHTLEICRDLLGLAESDVQALLAAGAMWAGDGPGSSQVSD